MKYIDQVKPYLCGKEKEALAYYLDSGGWLTEFKKTRQFECMLAEYTGTRFASIVTSGTAALYLALCSAGIGPGDKVVVPNYTMIATPNAVRWAGAEPVLVDVEADTLCLDLESVPMDPAVKALIYVSINGRCSSMERVADFCRSNEIVFIEDACQSLGSRWDGKPLGSFGDIGVFSFTPHKIITTGQGGAIVTRNEKYYKKLLKLKDFHRVSPATDKHDGIGFNFKFTDLQAVVGIEQLKEIDFRISRKKKIFSHYRSMLSDIEEIHFLPTELEQTTPWFIDPLLESVRQRDALQYYLQTQNIGCRPFYPPVNQQPVYAGQYQGRGNFQVSEQMAGRGLWLPSSIGINHDEVRYVCERIKQFFARR